MEVIVRLFAAAQEAAGVEELHLDLPDGATTEDALRLLGERYPPLQPMREALALAVNQQYVRGVRTLSAGDELALIPPISGGSTAVLTHAPIHLDPLIRQVQRHADGAVVTFLGTVRETSEGRRVVSMEYHAYEPMAARELEAIRAEVRERWGLEGVAIVHRLGHLQLGEVSVAIVVASPHRADAFEACRHAIERIKAVVPIWKKEHFAEGDEAWVPGVAVETG